METSDTGRCPKCGRKSYTTAMGSHRWYCHYCRIEFEDVDDGGRPLQRLKRLFRAWFRKHPIKVEGPED